MKKATNKVLSLVLVVMMLLGTFAMMFAYAEEAPAEETITTPKAYADAEDGEKLWDVDFSSEYWNVVDDRNAWVHNNGTNYLADGTPQDETKTGAAPGAPYKYTDAAKAEDEANKDVEGYKAQYVKPGIYNYGFGTFKNGWYKSLSDTATVIEEEGAALKIDAKVPANEEAGTAEIPADHTGADSRFIGQISAYDLENKTYTYEAEYFRKGVARSRIYFANGTFVNFGGCDPYMPNLGIELNASGYRLMRQSSAVTTGVVGKPTYKTDETTKEITTNMKIVLVGGEKLENVALYNSNWTKVTADNAYWVGDVIPVTFTIYNTIEKTAEDGTVTKMDIRCATGLIYQPASVNLVLGIGEYNNLGDNQYYGVRNVDIYKGDTSIPFSFGFEKVYNESGWGSELTLFDAKGITNDAYNYANGYEWYSANSVTYYVLCNETDAGALESYYETTKDGVTTWEKAWVKKVTAKPIAADAEGVVTIDIQPDALNRAASKVDKTKYILSAYGGATQMAATPHPFGDEWNYGYYEMELTVNNAHRLKIGLLQTADLERVGFDILPNGSYESLTNQQGDKTAYLSAGNAATLWTSGANSFGTGIVEKSTAALADDIKTIVYDTYKADDNTDEDTDPQDPRNVRDYGGNRANIKITFDCVNYVITLYEKVDGEWLATSAIDYSAGVKNETILGACLDFQAYNIGTAATIKNIRTMKGMSASHLHTYKVGNFESDLFVTYDEEFLADLTEEFTEAYGLWNTEFGWTNDGKTALDVEGLKAVYDALDATNYGPQTIKLAPIVKYEAEATEATLRGVIVDADEENGTYEVRFVSALGDIADVAAVGYDIVKTVSYGGYTKVTTTSVETTKVLTSVQANGIYLDAAAALGAKAFTQGEGENAVTYGYAASFGLEDEAVLEDAVVTYAVTVYTIALDGTKTASNETVTYSFYNGEYVPVLW